MFAPSVQYLVRRRHGACQAHRGRFELSVAFARLRHASSSICQLQRGLNPKSASLPVLHCRRPSLRRPTVVLSSCKALSLSLSLSLSLCHRLHQKSLGGSLGFLLEKDTCGKSGVCSHHRNAPRNRRCRRSWCGQRHPMRVGSAWATRCVPPGTLLNVRHPHAAARARRTRTACACSSAYAPMHRRRVFAAGGRALRGAPQKQRRRL